MVSGLVRLVGVLLKVAFLLASVGALLVAAICFGLYWLLGGRFPRRNKARAALMRRGRGRPVRQAWLEIRLAGSGSRRRCPHCGGPLDPAQDDVVCPQCYGDLKRVCPGCGEAVSVQRRYCPHCDAALARSP